ncbi:MAG: hypothetical protein KDC84_08085 [Crocinitomicaceae bacterium]|nr:hypothetical protein [Crocinitomicaceae bacterium]
MKNLILITLLSTFLLGACNVGEREYTSPLPGMWYIENAHGPHADGIVGGYIEFTEEGRFIWNTTKSVIEGSYKDMEEYFEVTYDGHEDSKKFDFKLTKEHLIIIPENSGQKFFLKKVQ